MVKKNKVYMDSIDEINAKLDSLKLELSKHKGILASKTKSNNTAKKGLLKKQIARLLTIKNKKKL